MGCECLCPHGQGSSQYAGVLSYIYIVLRPRCVIALDCPGVLALPNNHVLMHGIGPDIGPSMSGQPHVINMLIGCALQLRPVLSHMIGHGEAPALLARFNTSQDNSYRKTKQKPGGSVPQGRPSVQDPAPQHMSAGVTHLSWDGARFDQVRSHLQA